MVCGRGEPSRLVQRDGSPARVFSTKGRRVVEEEFEEETDKDDDDAETPPGAPRPLDAAFFEEWQKIRKRLLLYAIRASGSKARGVELVEQCFDKILNLDRPWREGWTLKRHCRWVIRGIQSNDFKNLSAHSLRRFAADPDPP